MARRANSELAAFQFPSGLTCESVLPRARGDGPAFQFPSGLTVFTRA